MDLCKRIRPDLLQMICMYGQFLQLFTLIKCFWLYENDICPYRNLFQLIRTCKRIL